MAMSDEKLVSLFSGYEHALNATLTFVPENPNLKHALDMIPKMRVFLQEGRREKLMRWLGFLQGVMFAEGMYDIAMLARHNMPDDAQFTEDKIEVKS